MYRVLTWLTSDVGVPSTYLVSVINPDNYEEILPVSSVFRRLIARPSITYITATGTEHKAEFPLTVDTPIPSPNRELCRAIVRKSTIIYRALHGIFYDRWSVNNIWVHTRPPVMDVTSNHSMFRERWVIQVTTYGGGDKLAKILQTLLSNDFPWNERAVFVFQFHWRLLPKVQLKICEHLLHKATSRCLKQWCLNLWTLYCRSQWVKKAIQS